jgi:hypothetical protein
LIYVFLFFSIYFIPIHPIHCTCFLFLHLFSSLNPHSRRRVMVSSYFGSVQPSVTLVSISPSIDAIIRPSIAAERTCRNCILFVSSSSRPRTKWSDSDDVTQVPVSTLDNSSSLNLPANSELAVPLQGLCGTCGYRDH